MTLRKLIQAIHDAPQQMVFVVAGAGIGALAKLLGVAGASRTLLEATIPYNQASFDEFLGQTPERYVDAKTARLLAGRALTRARRLRADSGIPVVGVACTATIATDRPKHGQHRAYIATWQRERLMEYRLYLEKEARDRKEEEALVSRVILHALAATYGLEMEVPLAIGTADRLEFNVYDFADAAQRLIDGKIHFFALNDHGAIRTEGVSPQTLFSGSFNPLHDGHLGMARAAAQILNRPTAFELSALNVDKPPLAADVILERISQFAGRHSVYVSDAPTFVEKARLFAGATFVIGYDTAVRLFVPQYYGGEAQMMAALEELRKRDCQFLVAGRVDATGIFRTVADIVAPAGFEDLLCGIPEELFRRDISSTELRAMGRAGSR